MNCEFLKRGWRGITPPWLRRGRLFNALPAGLALAIILVVPGFAQETTETIELGGGTYKYEITRSNGNIVRIKSFAVNEFNETTEKETQFDKNGYPKSEKDKFESSGYKSSYQRFWLHDSKGRPTSYKDYSKGYRPDNSGWKLTKDSKVIRTFEYDNGNVKITMVERDELTGKEDIDIDKYEYKRTGWKPQTANEKYKEILEQKRAEALKKFGLGLKEKKLGLAPPPSPPAPQEYAPATPRWLQGAYVSLSCGASFTASSAVTPTYRDSVDLEGINLTQEGNKRFPGRVDVSPRVVVAAGQYGCPFSDHHIFNYFGWKIEFSYQGLNYPSQGGTYQQTTRENGEPVASQTGDAVFSADGGLITLAFLVNGRYGFLPTPEHPFGQLQPFVGVGPALLINWFDPKIEITSVDGEPTESTVDFDGKTDVTVGLAAEAGVRYFFTRHIFGEIGYRYTYGLPSFSFQKENFHMDFDNSLHTHRVTAGVGLSF
jgi:opacity protein-like surface antigen